MKFDSDRGLRLLFIFLIGFINIGMSIGLALLLDDQATAKSQLLEFLIIILAVVFVNFVMLFVFSDE